MSELILNKYNEISQEDYIAQQSQPQAIDQSSSAKSVGDAHKIKRDAAFLDNALKLDDLHAFVRELPIGLIIYNPRGELLIWNTVALETSGTTEEQAYVGKQLVEYVTDFAHQGRFGDVTGKSENEILAIARNRMEVIYSTEYEYLELGLRNGRYYSQTKKLFPDGSLVFIMEDITERRMKEEQIAYMAYHDPLTGLGNRVMFNERLESAISLAQRHDQTGAILLCDLDGFKEVNDTYGHLIGDQLLIAVGERLKAQIRSSDAVARLGGDEFAIILTSIEHPGDVEKVAQKINASCCEPFSIDGQTVTIGASIGVAVFPCDGFHYETLLSIADQAMYRNKKRVAYGNQDFRHNRRYQRDVYRA